MLGVFGMYKEEHPARTTAKERSKKLILGIKKFKDCVMLLITQYLPEKYSCALNTTAKFLDWHAVSFELAAFFIRKNKSRLRNRAGFIFN